MQQCGYIFCFHQQINCNWEGHRIHAIITDQYPSNKLSWSAALVCYGHMQKSLRRPQPEGSCSGTYSPTLSLKEFNISKNRNMLTETCALLNIAGYITQQTKFQRHNQLINIPAIQCWNSIWQIQRHVPRGSAYPRLLPPHAWTSQLTQTTERQREEEINSKKFLTISNPSRITE